MRYPLLFSVFQYLLIFLILTSCSSYEELVIDGKISLPAGSSGYRFSDTAAENRSGLKSGDRRGLHVSSKKYLAKGTGFTPESKIINVGVDETMRGNYIEAEILFKQVQGDISDGSVENNLAVIYELTKREKDALEMYLNALVKSPDNSEFRSNLLSFISINKFDIKK